MGPPWVCMTAPGMLILRDQSENTVAPRGRGVKPEGTLCQGKVEMSPFWQSRNVPFCRVAGGVRVILLVPVKTSEIGRQEGFADNL